MHKLIIDLYKMNIPVVCAAGNSGSSGVGYPAAFPESIAIAAFDKRGMIAHFSSRGSQVDWAAPGADIYSTYLNQSYASLSGTSMACPFMAGVIALMIAKHREQEKRTGKNDCKTVQDIRDHLLKYTNDKGSVGKDSSWGYGVVDVQKLLATTTTSTTPKPTTTNAPTTTPAPQKKKQKSIMPFVKKNAAWIMFGVFALSLLGVALYNFIS
jgi:subtilisin family serine protease